MGSDGPTDSDIQADAFFAQFENPSIDLIARVRGEWSEATNLERVTAEMGEFGYWARKMAARDARRATRDLEATRAQQAQLDRLDTLRVTPAPTSSGAEHKAPMMLPAPRIAVLTDAERVETARWWQRLIDRRGTRTLVRRMRTEVRSEQEDARFQSRATKAWQLEQRAFERAQWLSVTKTGRARRKVEARWVAISEDRALEIALAALEHRSPPQGRK